MRHFVRYLALVILASTAVLSVGTGQAGAAPSNALPPIRHVFVIMLENQSYSSTFGNPSADPYLATTLPSKGALLTKYYATGHFSNDNYVSFVSGQPPNPDNQTDCQKFVNFSPTTVRNGIETGKGCVYPPSVANIGTQLTAKGLTWKGYMQDMGNVPTREAAACGHPQLGQPDKTQIATSGDGYATRHDPFVYFHSVINQSSYCNQHVVALGTPRGVMPASALPGETGLAHDLKRVKTTPNYSFITPNLCYDGHDYPCKNQSSGPSVGADMDSFLSTWVPKIMASPAYKQNGLIMITFDEAESPSLDTTACCHEKPGPAAAKPGLTGPGGGRVGAVLLSPYIAPGTKVAVPYNHYSALASFETIFGLSRLGEAVTTPRVFGAKIFTAPHGANRR